MESIWALWIDLASAKALVWLSSIGRDADLTAEAHAYFFDRYERLAECHRRRGRADKAKRYQLIARQHYKAGGFHDGPPYAAAMAMPRPKRFIRTDAVAHHRVDGPDDAA